MSFRYFDKGSMATIGRAAGVAEIGKIHLSGLIAWLAWCVVHVFFLIGFRNRVLVSIEWALLYLFHGRGSRLITGPVEEFRERPGLPRDVRTASAARAI